MDTTNIQYDAYRKSFTLKVKDCVRKLLKDSYLGRKIYPYVQRCWLMQSQSDKNDCRNVALLC